MARYHTKKIFHDAKEAGVNDYRSEQMLSRMKVILEAWNEFIENPNLLERYPFLHCIETIWDEIGINFFCRKFFATS